MKPVTVEIEMDQEVYALLVLVAAIHDTSIETFVVRAIVRHAVAVLDDKPMTPPEVCEVLELGIEQRRN